MSDKTATFHTPTKLTDLMDYAEEYMAGLSELESGNQVIDTVINFIDAYLENVPMKQEVLETIAIFIADHTYRFAMTVTTFRPREAEAFFSLLMRYFWDSVRARDVGVFYVLDNTLREDRFRLVCDLFTWSGFAVITPYAEGFDEAELKRLVEGYLAEGRNIAYIEKDASCNYLDRAVALAKVSGHTAVFRNRGPEDQRVLWWSAVSQIS